MAKAKPIVPDNDKDAILRKTDTLAVEYTSLKDMDKENSKREAEIKKEIEPIVRKMGTEDEKGGFLLETENSVLQLQSRMNVSINEEKAKELLEKKGVWLRVTKRTVDPKKLEDAHLDGEITDVEMAKILDQKQIHAFYARRKK